MPSVVTIAARALHTVALGLWLGGLIAIGALVAPTAFHLTRSLPALAGNAALQNAIAGGVVGGSLKLFVVLCYVCGILLLLTGAVLFRSSPRRPALACLIVSVLLLLSALYLGLSLTPALDAAQARNDFATFDSLHHQYEQISSLVQMPLLLLLAVLAAWRNVRPPRPNTGEPDFG